MSRLIAAAGPFQGLSFDNNAVYQDAEKLAYFAFNGYFVNTRGVKSWQGRPGFTRYGPILLAGTAPTQGMVSFVDPSSSTIYRFQVVNGLLYRWNADFTIATDVTPGAITIDNATTTRVAFSPLGTSCVVTDGVHRPWVMSNFGATPVTGAYIDLDGAGGAWTAYGRPTVFQGSVMFIAQTVPGGSAVLPRVGIVWSEPNQPTVGYTQSGYADFWNIIENNTEPIYAILGTNNGLFYFREGSIGVASGTPSLNFSTTATRDYRGDPVGSISPWAIVLFQNNVFFPDNQGRPWMMPLDSDPQPIWQQMPEANFTRDATALSLLTSGAVVPGLNQVALALFSEDNVVAPRYPYVFDGATGAFAGPWCVDDASSGVSGTPINAMETMLNASGIRMFALGTARGALWALGSAWADSAGAGGIQYLQTRRLGYTANRLIYPDYAVFILQSSQTIAAVTVTTAEGAQYEIDNIVPNSNQASGEYRAVVGLSGTATRWILLTIRGSATPSQQWGIQRVEVYGTTSAAGPEDS